MDEEKEKSWKNGQPLEKGVLLKPTQLGIPEALAGLLKMFRGGSKKPSDLEAARPVELNDDQKALLWLNQVKEGEADPGSISPRDYKAYKKSLLKYGYTDKDIEMSISRGKMMKDPKQAAYFSQMDELMLELQSATTADQRDDVRRRMADLEKGNRE